MGCSASPSEDARWLSRYSASTREAYARALGRFRAWCKDRDQASDPATPEELEEFLAFATSKWGREAARIAAVAIKGRGLIRDVPERDLPGHEAGRRSQRVRPRIPSHQQVWELSVAAWRLSPTHWALVELLVVTSQSVPQLCQLEGRDLRWHSWAPMGQIVIRSKRTGRVHVHGASDGLFEILLQFEDGPRRRLLRFADGRALNPAGARAMLREVAAVAEVDEQLALQGLRRFGAEMDRRLADNLGMTVQELYRYKRAAAADSLPLDDPPPPPSEFAKAYLKAADERVRYALRDS